MDSLQGYTFRLLSLLLSLSLVQEYAREGLRTLVVAKKELTEDEYFTWAEEHHAARYASTTVGMAMKGG